MTRLVLLCACLALASATPDRKWIPDSLHFLSDEYIDYINNMNTTWKGGRNFDSTTSRSKISLLMGALEQESPKNLKVYADHDSISESFDSRQHWPNCPTIKEIYDQGSCGSCWAFGAAEAMSDRLCIATGGKVKVVLSVEDLLGCCAECGFGCSGGYPSAAWEYYQVTGVVTGGRYASHDSCKPYSIAPCSHHVNGTYKSCDEIADSDTPRCVHQCNSGYGKSLESDRYFGQNSYLIKGEKSIQKEILTHGPVEALFYVYEDFPHYKSGVYQRHSEIFLGAHAVKIIGWGVENGVKYWLVANSWNTEWGDKGFFKILRGHQECGIEQNVVAGLPKV